MLKLIMAALVIGVLWAALSGRTPELPPQLVERIETAKEVWQTLRESTQEATPLSAETKPKPLALTPTEPAPPRATITHPYQDLLTAGVVTQTFGSKASESDLPAPTDVATRPSETPAETQVFTEDYYRLKQRLLSAIAILEGQGNER